MKLALEFLLKTHENVIKWGPLQGSAGFCKGHPTRWPPRQHQAALNLAFSFEHICEAPNRAGPQGPNAHMDTIGPPYISQICMSELQIKTHCRVSH